MDDLESKTTIHQPEPQAGDRIRWAETLQFTARLGAILLVAAYGCGFITLLIYHSAFKIADFGLMQPRILAAGFLFLLFLMLPVLAISRMYSIFGLTKLTGREITASEENKGRALTILRIVDGPCSLFRGLGILDRKPDSGGRRRHLDMPDAHR